MGIIPARKVARILSIDGGGIRGLIPATILRAWEIELGPIANRFHMVAGTSTGGILSCALTKPSPVPASNLVEMYQKRGPEIFAGDWTSLGGVASQIYDAAGLEKVVGETLGKATLGQCTKDLMVTTYDIERRTPYLFKSWKARGYELNPTDKPKAFDFALKDVSRATSAAPTYFQPAKIKALDGTTYAVVDGGVFANNPAMCAYVAARRLYPNADEYIVVSIGTGATVHPIKYDDAISFGLVGWLKPLLDILFDGSSATTEYQLSQLPQVTQYRFQTDLTGSNEAMDDVSADNLANLVKVAQASIAKFTNPMHQLMAKLQEPLTTLDALGYPAKLAPVKPGTQVVSQAKVKPKPATTAALIGAGVGTAIAPGPGTVAGAGVGYGLGWLSDKIGGLFS
jgi:predicted acylesterase/phospholipase RssA